jgi:hypothetical protein
LPLTPLEIDALEYSAKAIPYAAKRIYSSGQIRRIARGAQSQLISIDPRFLDELSPVQVNTLKSLINSPAFTHLSLQAVIFSLGSQTESQAADLREQVRSLIQNTGLYSDGDLFQVTDFMLDLLNRSAQATIWSAGLNTFRRVNSTAVAAEVAASAARNSQLLRRLQTLDEINTFAEALKAQARALHTKINTTHIERGEGIDYSSLYIAPTLNVDGDDIRPNRLVTDSLRIVILGDPGAGKSTLTSKLVYEIASDKIPELKGYVPILLVVRNHASGLREESHTLVHYLEQACRRPYNLEPPPDALEYLLLNGRAIVIIDGVDELGDGNHRRNFASMVNGFAHRYPLTRIVVTSRVIGYKDAPLDSELFLGANILPFTDAQVEEYTRKWFALNLSIDEQDKESWSTEFLQASEAAKDLRTNPLLISLLCSLYHRRRSLPRNKPEIYEKCAELLFDTWDRQRGIEAPYYFAPHIRPAVQQIAWLMFNDPGRRQALPRSELRQFLAEYMLFKRFPDPDDAIQAADDFLNFCSDRAWVLTEVGSNALMPQYGFVHRTFLEFFAASQLVRLGPDPRAVWKVLRTKITSAEWDIVCQLAVQILNGSYNDGADGLLQLIMQETATELRNNKERGAALVAFAARTLDNVTPDNSTISSIVSMATHIASVVPTSQRRLIGPSRDAGIHEDAALAAIFRLQNPDNQKRVAHAVANALEGEVKAAGRPSASLIYAVLRELSLSSPTGDLVHEQLKVRQASATISEWNYLIFAPSPVDIRRLGLYCLYQYTEIFGFQVPSTVSRLVSAPYGDDSSTEAASLARWLDAAYDVIIEERLGEIDPDTELLRRIGSIRQSDFEALVPRAKGSFLVLLAPTLSSFARSPYTSGAAMIVKLLTNAITHNLSDASRSRTIEIINDYKLPFWANSILTFYISEHD